MLMFPEFGFNKWGGGPQNLPQAWFTRRTHLTQKSCWYSWFLFITMERHVLKSSKGKGKAHGAESRRNQGPASRCPLPVQHHWCARNLLRDGSRWEVLPASEVPWSLGVQGSVAKAQSHSALMREDISECQSSSPGTGQGPVLKTSLPWGRARFEHLGLAEWALSRTPG